MVKKDKVNIKKIKKDELGQKYKVTLNSKTVSRAFTKAEAMKIASKIRKLPFVKTK